MLLSKLARSRGLGCNCISRGAIRNLAAPIPAPTCYANRSTSTSNPAPKSGFGRRAAAAGGLFALGVGLGMAWSELAERNSLFPKVRAAQLVNPASEDGISRRKANNFISDVVKSCSPGVVYIEIIDGRFQRVVSNGSGFIVSDDGLIMTNAHVVSSRIKNTVVVKLQDGRSYVGKIEDMDMTGDLALLRIPSKNLQPMKLGSSSDLEAGEWVVAMGSPLSLSNTVTAGVVSSTNRKSNELGIQGKGMDYIQTDASITFGNSGGPLVNLDGEVIGINAMKITAGISFAIPIDYAKQFLNRYIEKTKAAGWMGKVETRNRRYMGVTMVTITPELRYEMTQRNMISLPDDMRGVFVVKVVVGSPAHKGGLRPGDVISHINGQSVASVQDIFRVLESNQQLELAVRRGVDTLDFTIVPED